MMMIKSFPATRDVQGPVKDPASPFPDAQGTRKKVPRLLEMETLCCGWTLALRVGHSPTQGGNNITDAVRTMGEGVKARWGWLLVSEHILSSFGANRPL